MGRGLTKYNALIVDPDLDNRMRLKQVTASVPMFGLVRQCGALFEGTAHIESDTSFVSVIFVSDRYPEADIASFIQKCKQTKQSQDAAFVMVQRTAKEGSVAVAAQMAIGADGFLVEPYSVNSLVEITNLANRVRGERGESRAKIAATMLVNDMMQQIDLVSFLKSCGYEVGKSMAKLREMGQMLKDVGDEYESICQEVVVRIFSDAPPPKKLFQVKKYGGVSDRVRKRMEAKLMADMEAKKALDKATKK